VVNDILYAIGGHVGWQVFPGGSTTAVEQYTPFGYGYGVVPPTISIVSPENKTYAMNNVSLTFTVDKPTTRMSYSIDGQNNITITGNTTIVSLSNGLHNITVYATNTYEYAGASETVTFSIAEPEPAPFPTTLVAAASGASVAVVVVALLVYFKKRNH
jgi:hypothetical protein